MANLSNEELLMIAVLLDEEEEELKIKRRTRNVWVHPAWQKRTFEGEFVTLYKELVDDESKFYQYFRMTMYSFNKLLNTIESEIQRQDTRFRKCISPRHRLAVTLRYLATGDSLKTISFSYRLGHSTVYTIVIDTCRAIIKKLMLEVMPVPTENKWREIAEDFWAYWNFPNCIGALDGKHIVIQAPPNSGSLYFNYKKTFSIVLLALVDAHYNFIAIDVGAYGKNSDGGILINSKLGKMLDTNNMNVPSSSTLPGTSYTAPFVILGDEAFPLKSYLLRPYPGKQLDCEKKRIYNYRHCRTRRVVENAFGILTQKFRIFNRRIQANPENADLIVLASCVLHNFIKIYDGKSSYSRNVTEGTPLNETTLNTIQSQGGNATQEAFHVRELFTDFFNSPSGTVSWQNEYI